MVVYHKNFQWKNVFSFYSFVYWYTVVLQGVWDECVSSAHGLCTSSWEVKLSRKEREKKSFFHIFLQIPDIPKFVQYSYAELKVRMYKWPFIKNT